MDLALLGEAVEAACRPQGLRRVNYEILGNALSFLHGHVVPRYEWEPAGMVRGPVWRYPEELRSAPEHAYDDERHGALRAAITDELVRLMDRAYE